jgi:hypothetical protein
MPENRVPYMMQEVFAFSLTIDSVVHHAASKFQVRQTLGSK